MSLLKNPTRNIFRKQKREKNHTPQSHFRCSLFKKGRKKFICQQERRSGRADGFQTAQLLCRGEEETCDGLLAEKREGRQSRRGEEGAIKTLTSLLVYGVKKAPHAQQARG